MSRKSMTKKEPETYSTTNIYELAFCLYHGLTLAGKETSGPKTKVIVAGTAVINGKKLNPREVVLEFYNSEFRKFFDCYKTVRDFTHQEKTKTNPEEK